LRLDVDLRIKRICATTFECSLGKRQPLGDVQKGHKARTWLRFQHKGHHASNSDALHIHVR
jgi:hypothetical protein